MQRSGGRAQGLKLPTVPQDKLRFRFDVRVDHVSFQVDGIDRPLAVALSRGGKVAQTAPVATCKLLPKLGKHTGVGRHVYKDGSKYTGSLEGGVRQGRGTLADIITNAPTYSADELRDAAERSGGSGAGGGGSGPPRSSDPASQLSEEQRRMLEAGVHPSRIPGMEGGIEVELGKDNKPRIVPHDEL